MSGMSESNAYLANAETLARAATILEMDGEYDLGREIRGRVKEYTEKGEDLARWKAQERSRRYDALWGPPAARLGPAPVFAGPVPGHNED